MRSRACKGISLNIIKEGRLELISYNLDLIINDLKVKVISHSEGELQGLSTSRIV